MLGLAQFNVAGDILQKAAAQAGVRVEKLVSDAGRRLLAEEGTGFEPSVFDPLRQINHLLGLASGPPVRKRPLRPLNQDLGATGVAAIPGLGLEKNRGRGSKPHARLFLGTPHRLPFEPEEPRESRIRVAIFPRA